MSVSAFVRCIVEYGIEGSLCNMRWEKCLTDEIVHYCLHLYICVPRPRVFTSTYVVGQCALWFQRCQDKNRGANQGYGVSLYFGQIHTFAFMSRLVSVEHGFSWGLERSGQETSFLQLPSSGTMCATQSIGTLSTANVAILILRQSLKSL